MNWQDIIVALGSAGLGGILLKMAESWLNRSKQKNEHDRALRDELRSEASALKAEILTLKEKLKQAEKELDEMREKYWDIYTEYKIFKLHVQRILVSYGIDPAEFIYPEKKKESD